MRAGVIVAGLLMGMWIVPGFASANEPAAKAKEAATPAAASAKTAPTPAGADAKAKPAAAATANDDEVHRELLYKGLAETHPKATKDQLTCASEQILEKIGWARFQNLVALGMARAAGQNPEPSAEATEDVARLEAITSGCGIPSS